MILTDKDTEQSRTKLKNIPRFFMSDNKEPPYFLFENSDALIKKKKQEKNKPTAVVKNHIQTQITAIKKFGPVKEIVKKAIDTLKSGGAVIFIE